MADVDDENQDYGGSVVGDPPGTTNGYDQPDDPPGTANRSDQPYESNSQGQGDANIEKACTVCKYNNIRKKATDVCTTCDEMFLCQECRSAHRQKSVSKYHTIIPICVQVADDMTCDNHDSRPLKYFCLKCEDTACSVCVVQLHDGHDVRNFFVYVQETCGEMSDAKKKSEMRANDLYALDSEMKDIKQTLTDRMHGLKTQVEDHANTAVKQILRQRDEMVFKVQKTCDVNGIEQTMEEWVQVRERIANGIQRWEELSAGSVSSAGQMKELLTAKNELKILGNYKQVSSGPYRERLYKLPSFVPMSSEVRVGKLVERGSRPYRDVPQAAVEHQSGSDVKYKDLTGNFDLPFPLQNQYRHIHSVVFLKPEGFAVLAAQKEVGPASAVLLWVKEAFHVVSHGIHPAWDMDVDTQGVITVLCSTRPYLRMIDPETRSKCGIIDIKGELSYPQSLAVNSHRGQYVVLDGMGNHRLVVLDRDGTVLQYLKVGWDHWRIACDAKFMATCSSQEISIYEWNQNRLGKTRSFLHGEFGLNIRDVACHRGDVFVAGSTGDEEKYASVVKIPGKNLFQTFELQPLSFGDGDLALGDNWWLRCDINDDRLVLGCRARATNIGRVAVFPMNQEQPREEEANDEDERSADQLVIDE